jgi:LysM repeat protein
MRLKIPLPECTPGAKAHECHMVVQGDALDTIAVKYATTQSAIINMNSDALNGDSSVVVGMDLLIPRRPITLNPPLPCVASDWWACYLVKKDDTLGDVALNYGTNPVLVAKWNQLKNASELQVGQLLAVPTAESLACAPRPGVWTCGTNDANIAGSFTSMVNIYPGGFDPRATAWNEIRLDSIGSYAGYSPPPPPNAVFGHQVMHMPIANCVPTSKYSCVPYSEATGGKGPVTYTCLDRAASCEQSAGTNHTKCALIQKPAQYGNNSNCYWDESAGRCQSKCDGYTGEATCDSHTAPKGDYYSPSCKWSKQYLSIGFVDGKDFFGMSDIYYSYPNVWSQVECPTSNGSKTENCILWPQESSDFEKRNDMHQKCFGQGVSAHCPQVCIALSLLLLVY